MEKLDHLPCRVTNFPEREKFMDLGRVKFVEELQKINKTESPGGFALDFLDTLAHIHSRLSSSILGLMMLW